MDIFPGFTKLGGPELIRELGISYRELEENRGVMMPVTEMKVRYVRPAKYDDLLTLKTRVEKFPKKTLYISHTEVFNAQNKLLNAGYIALVFVDQATMKVVELPQYIGDKIRSYFSESDL